MKSWWQKGKERGHLLAFLVYFLAVTLVRLVFAEGRWQWEMVSLWLGGMVGFMLVLADRLIYIYWLKPHEQLSQQVRYYLAGGRWKQALSLLIARRQEQWQLVFRSFLFQVAWVPLALFALTSTGELFAGGLLMGMGLHMLYDDWMDQKRDPAWLNRVLFWQVKRPVGMREQGWFLALLTAMFVILSRFLLI
jgi:hypothetical protein